MRHGRPVFERSETTDSWNARIGATTKSSFTGNGSSEDRRYQLWLYNAYRNWERPHQGLNGETPAEVFRREYPVHYAALNY